MKKLFALILVIGLMTSAGAETLKAQSPLNFGIRGGLNIANLNNVDDTDARTGLLAGAYLNFKVPMSPVSIQPEILYAQKGFEATTTVSGQQVNATTKLDYIEVPVLAKFSFAPGPLTPKVYFGPYVGFNVKAEVEAESGGNSASVDVKDSIKDTDFGVVVGAEVSFSKLNVGLRYGAGLTKIAEDDSDGKNGVFSIVAGISL